MNTTPHLKPATFAEILDGTLRIFARNFKVMWLLGLVYFGFIQWILDFASRRMETAMADPLTGVEAGLELVWFLAVFLLMMGLSLLLYPPMIAGMTQVAVRGGQNGGTVSFRKGLQASGHFALPALGTLLLYGLLWLTGMAVPGVLALIPVLGLGIGLGDWAIAGVTGLLFWLLLSVPTLVFIHVRFSLAVPVLVVEGTPYWTALKRSWVLTRGAFWRILGLSAVIWILSTLFNLMGSTVSTLTVLFPPSLWVHVLASTVTALLVCVPLGLFPVFHTVLYWDRRVRAEGWDIEAELDRWSTPSAR